MKKAEYKRHKVQISICCLKISIGKQKMPPSEYYYSIRFKYIFVISCFISFIRYLRKISN